MPVGKDECKTVLTQQKHFLQSVGRSQVLQTQLFQLSQGNVKPTHLCVADPALLVVIGVLSYLGWWWSAAVRKVLLCSFFSTFVSKVMLLRKFLVAVEKFPVVRHHRCFIKW